MNRCNQPGCNLAGDSIGRCGNAGGPLPCGQSVPVKPSTDVLVHCAPCDKTWAISIPGSVLKRGASMPKCCGSTDRCRAVIVPQEKAKPKVANA